MTKKVFSSVQKLACLNAVLIAAALILSVVSSNTAYSLMHLTNLILACAAAIVLDMVVFFAGEKLTGAVTDLFLFACVFLTAFAMCELIRGRVLLAGYIYFSDLESSNPVAIAAMNLAIAAVAAYLLALILNIVNGFSKHAKD